MSLSNFIIFGLVALLFTSCQGAVQREKTLADLYPDYLVFSPSQLSKGEIAIEDQNGRFGESVEIDKLQYSEKVHILLGKVNGPTGFSIKDLSEQIETTIVLPAPKCSTTWEYRNETYVVDNCFFALDPVMFASYQEQTKVTLPESPFLKAKLAANLAEDIVYRCKYKVRGITECKNFCSCGGCIDCTFYGIDKALIVPDVPRPNRDADSTTSFPCNSMNQC
jgi:hypothetical protein